jgi:pseudouridine kinase
MEIYSHLTPEVLEKRLKLFNGSGAVVLDANLPEESIRYLAENCTAPLFADPVSTAKAGKFRDVLGKLHTIKPNRLEAELLSGMPIQDEDSLRRAAERLLETGLRRVIVSLGKDGVFALDRDGNCCRMNCLPGKAVNATGCGDAFMAAAVWAFLREAGLEDTIKAGLAASAITMEAAETNSPLLNEETLMERAEIEA